MIREVAGFIAAGFDAITNMAIAGTLPKKHLWLALKGSGKFAKAIATGDVRTEYEASRFFGACLACPSMTVYGTRIGADAHYCGPRLEEHQTTCGCLVGITIDGVASPAGKSLVRSETCPQGR